MLHFQKIITSNYFEPARLAFYQNQLALGTISGRYINYLTKEANAFGYSLVASCSKGKIIITPTPRGFPKNDSRRRMCYLETFDKPHEYYLRRDWCWKVYRVNYRLNKKTVANGKFSGREQSLYRAAQHALQTLFGCSRTSVTELMKRLVDDQIMFTLSGQGQLFLSRKDA